MRPKTALFSLFISILAFIIDFVSAQNSQSSTCSQYCDLSSWQSPLCYQTSQGSCNFQKLQICGDIPSNAVNASSCITGPINIPCQIASGRCGALSNITPSCGNGYCEVGEPLICPQDCDFWSDGVRMTESVNIYSRCPGLDPLKRYFVLTYDDGPSEFTPGILKALNDNNVLATFFTTGAVMASHIDTLKSIVTAGHIVGSNTYSRFNLSSLTTDELLDDAASFDEVAIALVGYKPKFLRPPYGSLTQLVSDTYNSTDVRFTVVGWNADLLDDSSVKDPNEVIDDLSLKLQLNPGIAHIIALNHVSNKISVDVAPQLISYLREEGYEATTLDNCIFGSTDYVLRLSTRQLQPKPVSKLVISQGADDTSRAHAQYSSKTWLGAVVVSILIIFHL